MSICLHTLKTLALHLETLAGAYRCGPTRTDVVYDVAAGRVFLVAHVPDAGAPADLRVSVGAAAAQALQGLHGQTLQGLGSAAGPAELALRYQPPGGGLDALGLAVNAAAAAALTAAAGASLVTSLLAPLATSGVFLEAQAVVGSEG